MHRRYLVDSSMLEIVLAYNAEMRGIANYYRLAYVAKFSLRKLWFLWETSLLKTLAFKLRLSVNQAAHRLKTRDGLAVRFKVDGKERSVAVFNLKHIDRLPNLGPNVDRWAVPHFTKGRSDVMDRLRAKQCEYCGSTDNPCEVHHSRRLADVKDTPLWKQVAAARRRKRVVLCLPCHKALHARQLKPLDSGDASTESRMTGNYHVRFGGRERRVLIEARPSRPNAELGAAFLAADLGLCIEPRPDHASYIASWIKVLQNDTRAIVQATARAERAVAYLRQLAAPKEIEKAAQIILMWPPKKGRPLRLSHPPTLCAGPSLRSRLIGFRQQALISKSASTRTRRDGNLHPNIPVEPVENPQQPVDGETLQFDLTNTRKIGRRYAGAHFRIAHRQPLSIKRFGDLSGKDRTKLANASIGLIEVGINIARTANQFKIVIVVSHRAFPSTA